MSESEQGGAGRREVAYRLFATEFEDADLSYSESDEERAPNYVITPTGARVNRLFVVGVLTEVEQVSEDVLRGRVVDPTGAFVLYAGQYQPDEMAFLESTRPPTFVAVTGKARTFQPDDSEQVFTSIRPESINEVDAETRDRWSLQAAEQTLDRIGQMARALSMDERGDDLREALTDQGVDSGLAAGIPIALDHYGTTPRYLAALREVAVDAARVVAGQKDEVPPLDVRPDDAGDTTVADLRETATVGRDVPETTAAATGRASTDTDSATEQSTAQADRGGADVEAAREGGTAGAESASETESHSGSDDPATPASGDPDDTSEPTETTPPTGAESVETTGDSSESEPTEAPGGSPEAASAAGTSSPDDAADDDLGDFDPGEFELEEETREQIEEEYGTEFQTGTEVDDPGSADIDTSSEEAEAEESAATESTETAEPAAGSARGAAPPAGTESETAAETGSTADGEATGVEGSTEAPAPDESTQPADAGGEPQPEDAGTVEEPDDLQAAVVDLMSELDDGDGAERESVLREMGDRYGTDEAAVEEAIQDALMDGQCYEPDETTLKPI